MRYLVRCARCDRAFWLPERGAALPAHNRWDRRAEDECDEDHCQSLDEHDTEHCRGSAQPGYWIGEDEEIVG